MIVTVLDHSRRNCLRAIFELPLNGANGIVRDLQIGGQGVCRPEWHDAERGLGVADHALQHIMNRAIAAAGKDGVVSRLDRFFGLRSRLCRTRRRQNLGLDSRTAELIGRGFDLMDAPVTPESRERIVDK